MVSPIKDWFASAGASVMAALRSSPPPAKVEAAVKDQDGNKTALPKPDEPQTAKLGHLHREFAQHPSRGLTPSRLATILETAERGDVIAQYELFEDMEEKDAHIASEMGKRRRAVSQLDWDLLPPANPSAAEKRNTAALKELICSIDNIQDAVFDTTDAIGKGFVNQELEWHRVGRTWLPKSIEHRPQTWFQFHRGYRPEIRLRNQTTDGDPLQPFGWISHIHRAKSGYVERAALFRVLAWPFLFKNYSVGDLAEFLEIYGIPFRLGKYGPNATNEEKATLMRMVVGIGHNAAAIIPESMAVDFQKAAEGDPKAFELMIDWCERSQSKAILGATLTSQADRGSNTNALGTVHNEVRKDLRDADVRQIGATWTRDLVYPIGALNGLVDDMARCPRLVFDVREPEDLKLYSEALPPLVQIGMKIPMRWAAEKLRIPEPEGDEPVLTSKAEPADKPPEPPAVAAAKASLSVEEARDLADDIADQLAERAAPITGQWIDLVREAVDAAESYDGLLARLAELQTELPLDELGMLLQNALGASGLAGQDDARSGTRSKGGNRPPA